MQTISRIEQDDVNINPRSGRRVDEPAPPHHGGAPICAECRCRPAVTRVRRRYVVLADHDMCRQCWRSRVASLEAERHAEEARRQAEEARRRAGHATRRARRAEGWER